MRRRGSFAASITRYAHNDCVVFRQLKDELVIWKNIGICLKINSCKIALHSIIRRERNGLCVLCITRKSKVINISALSLLFRTYRGIVTEGSPGLLNGPLVDDLLGCASNDVISVKG